MPTFTPDHLIRCRRLGAFDISPDGRWLVVAVDELSSDGKRYDTNLYRLDVTTPGAALTALTSSTRKKSRPRFAPDGTLGFLAQPDPSKHGDPPAPDAAAAPSPAPSGKSDEEPPLQVHLLRMDGGEAEQVTDLPNGVKTFRWTKDGRRLVLLAPVHASAASLDENKALETAWKERKESGRVFDAFPLRFWDHFLGPRHAHVVACDADGSAPRDLTPGLAHGLDEAELDVSPDGRFAVVDLTTFGKDLQPDTQLWRVDLASGERMQLTRGPAQHWDPRWSPDGSRIACLRQAPSPRVTGKCDAAVVDAASGEVRVLTASLATWPGAARFLDASRLMVTGDEDGHHRLRLFDLASGSSRVLVSEGHATEPCGAPDGRTAYCLLDRIHHPADLFAVPSAGGDLKRLTAANAALLDGIRLAPGIPHVFEGEGGRAIQAWEVRPPDFDPAKRYPLLLWIHGGPVSSYLDQFHYRWNAQLYAALGHVVLEVNPRGSTGFGQDLVEDNNGDWGNRCYRDLMRAVDLWEKKPHVDPARMAALGGSFGGYMVNWIAGHARRFKCLVSHAGLYNLTAFHGTTDGGPWWELEFGVPWKDAAAFDANSPHVHAGAFQTPTLVIHGETDYRVPLADGLQMFYALQRTGTPSQFLYFPDENHWILKPANMKQWNGVVMDWLARWLE